MPLSGSGAILGPLLAVAAGSIDAKGIAAWTGVATQLTTWLVANCTVKRGTMTAAGAAVTGAGALSFPDATPLGPLLALGAGSVDAAGIAKWTNVGKSIVSFMTSSATGVPSSFVVSNPMTGGAVTGAGLVACPPIPNLFIASGSVDGPGIAAWTLVGAELGVFITANTVLLPTPLGMVAPPGGGLLTGSGTIT